MSSRRPITAPVAPRTPSPEEAAAADAFKASLETYTAERSALLASARALAERLQPGRVHGCGGGFRVMFGDPSHHGSSFAGPGLVELTVDTVEVAFHVHHREGTALPSPALKLTPSAYSLGSNADLAAAEAQGLALIECSRLGRTLLALTA